MTCWTNLTTTRASSASGRTSGNESTKRRTRRNRRGGNNIGDIPKLNASRKVTHSKQSKGILSEFKYFGNDVRVLVRRQLTLLTPEEFSIESSNLIKALDERRGCIFESSYEYPGRYARWTMGHGTRLINMIPFHPWK